MKRTHGLQLPLDPHQIGSWVLFSFLVAGVYALYVPFVEPAAARYALLVIYTVLVAIVICLATAASATDPSETGMGAGEGTFYCTLCEMSVGRSSKHCKACNRCVTGFDHHCKWLNNCVGAKNYRAFFLLVLLTLTMLLLQLGWGIWLLAHSFYDSDAMSQLVDERYGLGHLNYHGWQAVLLLYLLLLCAAVLMLGELLSFHAVLVAKNMTTYDFITAQRQAHGSAPSVSGGPDNGARAALCGRSNRVADVSAPAVSRKFKVSLNPCTACSTTKPEGSPQTWQLAAKGATADSPAAAAVFPSSDFRVQGQDGKCDAAAGAPVFGSTDALACHSGGLREPGVPELWTVSHGLGPGDDETQLATPHTLHHGANDKAAGAVAEAACSSPLYSQATSGEQLAQRHMAPLPAEKQRSCELRPAARAQDPSLRLKAQATRTIANLEVHG